MACKRIMVNPLEKVTVFLGHRYDPTVIAIDGETTAKPVKLRKIATRVSLISQESLDSLGSLQCTAVEQI